MNFQDLFEQSLYFRHAIRINALVSIPRRLILGRILAVLVIIGLIGITASLAFGMFDLFRLVGFTLLAASAWLVLFALDAYVFSYLFRELTASPRVTFELAEVVLRSDQHDLAAGFLVSSFGGRVWRRLGLLPYDLETFYADRRGTVSALTVPTQRTVNGALYAKALYESDEDLKAFLFTRGVNDEVFAGAVDWVQTEITGWKQRYRWWSVEHLREIPGIGKDWSFGTAYHLERYARAASSLVRVTGLLREYYREEVDHLESVLSRGRSANAVLVGETGSGLRDAIAVFADRITRQIITPQLEHYRVYVLDTDLLIADHSSKEEFEETLVRIFDGALKTENIVIVIEHLPAFLTNAAQLGSNPANLLEGYFEDPRLHVIATSTPDAYYDRLSSDPRLKRWFDRVNMEHDDHVRITRLLEELAVAREGRSLLVTYPAVQAVYESARRYLTGGVMPDVALDLLEEVISLARSKGQDRVTKRFVESVVEDKTGVPIGEADEGERKRLLNLEDILHQKIVGQDAAVSAVSDALRRSRSGVSSPDRPLGVFLFLGPTGVGKTETAKVLADTFFDSRDDIIRIDMSEYSEGDALSRLIGNVGAGMTGMLASAVNDNPYSVLLLDEFEKTTQDVHDLFLQIFDEGVFHDAYGNEVNCRNMIIIATSNAASDTIRSLVGGGEELAAHKHDIIDQLISTNAFRPELINRFDDVVLFHPLSKEDTAAVAERELAKLQIRLNKRGVSFEITQTLVEYLVEHGYDEQFGARAIRRIITGDIEKVISHKLLTGEIKKGDTAVISEEDLASLAKPNPARVVTDGIATRVSNRSPGSDA
ncbi:MAG: ATP-dependent Clp protease ATP-binding subunit [Candidatus Paceibacterota bacterium]